MSIPGGPPRPERAADSPLQPRRPPFRLLLVRHGQSTWNDAHRIQGQLDPPLSELGLDQAALTAERLAAANLAGFYCSDLVRTRQTAAPLAERLGVEPTYDPGLREVALGEWEGLTGHQIAQRWPDVWDLWQEHPSWDLVPGGEGQAAFEGRVAAALAAILDRHPEGDVLVVTHGGVIQVALSRVVGASSAGLFPFLIENCSLTTLQGSRRGLVVTAVNDTCHLR